MVVVSGSNAQQVAEQLALALKWDHVQLEARRFPDTEGYIRIPEEQIEAIRKEPVVVVSNTFPDAGMLKPFSCSKQFQMFEKVPWKTFEE